MTEQEPQDGSTSDTRPAAVDVPVDSEQSPDADTNPSREAAKSRTRLREVEGEVERLTEALASAQRGQIETLVGSALTPEVFWKLVDPAELLDESGVVDPTLVKQATQKVRAELGPAKTRGPLRGFTSGAQSGAPARPPSFADAFAPKQR